MAEELVAITFKAPISIREWLMERSEANHRSMAGELNYLLDKVVGLIEQGELIV